MKIEEFETGLEKKIVDYIQKIPHNVYEICIAQYNESKTKDDINRLHHNIDIDEFFTAPYKVYQDDTPHPLQFYTTMRAITWDV